MFSAGDIQERVQEQPYIPMRIVTGSGQTFDVRHPDLIMVGRRSLVIGTASSENPRQYESVSRVSLIHVTALEDLPAAAPSEDNGESSS